MPISFKFPNSLADVTLKKKLLYNIKTCKTYRTCMLTVGLGWETNLLNNDSEICLKNEPVIIFYFILCAALMKRDGRPDGWIQSNSQHTDWWEFTCQFILERYTSSRPENQTFQHQRRILHPERLQGLWWRSDWTLGCSPTERFCR